MASPKKNAKGTKRTVQVGSVGQAHIKATFNNIIVTMTNAQGEVVSWSSAGKMGFRGSKKNTPYAAQVTAADCARVAFELGMKEAKAFIKGIGIGREAAVRSIQDVGILVSSIRDVTPMPHNGCRPPKRRRP